MTTTRCLFVLPSLGGGGAERVVTTLLRHLNADRFDLHLAVARLAGPLVESLPQHVTIHDLAAARVARSLVPLLRTVRRLQPDVVFSTLLHMNLATALTTPCWPRGVRLVLRETNLLDRTLVRRRFSRLRRAVYRTLYRRADLIVCQTPGMQAELQHVLRLPREQLVVIPNPVDFAAIRKAVEQAPVRLDPGPNVVALGRLRKVKGTERLLDAFPQLLLRHPTAHLWLLGDGPCETELRHRATSLRIDRHVHFVGFQCNPYAWLGAADLMAVSSYSESCSNAILEAVACGCPTVALRHPGGTQDMLVELGLGDRFVAQLDKWDEKWFQAPPPVAAERARATYDVMKVVSQFENVLA